MSVSLKIRESRSDRLESQVVGTAAAGAYVLGEQLFREALLRERRRSERQGATFAVVVVDSTSPPTPGTSDEPSATPSPRAAAATPFTGLSADDFDPQGAAPQEENPESVPNVLDGDPATSWSTSTYRQNFGPSGLKTGVGLVLDLGTSKGVRRVVVSTTGGQTSLAAYVTSEPPAGVADLTPVGTASGTGDLVIDLEEAVSGRYVTVWLTLLPQVDDGFRGTITEVQVLG